MAIKVAPGLQQVAPPLLTQGPSLFSGRYRAQWGPIGAPNPPTVAPVVPVPTKEQRAGGDMGPFAASMGRVKMVTPRVAPREQVIGAPRLTNVQNNPPWWKPTIFWWKPAPGYARHTRVFSDYPLPVPSLQAGASNPVAQKPARIGGQTVTRWPPAQTRYPTFGPGGT